MYYEFKNAHIETVWILDDGFSNAFPTTKKEFYKIRIQQFYNSTILQFYNFDVFGCSQAFLGNVRYCRVRLVFVLQVLFNNLYQNKLKFKTKLKTLRPIHLLRLIYSFYIIVIFTKPELQLPIAQQTIISLIIPVTISNCKWHSIDQLQPYLTYLLNLHAVSSVLV